jgi:hypothetical protein
MKKLLIMLIFLVLPMTCAARDGWQETCKQTSSLAREIMQIRQKGVPESKLIDTLSSGGNEAANRVTTQLILRAYKQPHYQTPAMQDRSVQDFENETYSACADELTK